jgi:hypothetical protein
LEYVNLPRILNISSIFTILIERTTDHLIIMSNLLRRASDAFHHHQRKSSEDSVNQDSLVNPAQEPQEPVEPQIPAVSQPEPQESKVEAAAGESKDQAGKDFLPVSLELRLEDRCTDVSWLT